MTMVGRNQPCPCGSGKKYKQCCLAADDAARLASLKSAQPQSQLDSALNTIDAQSYGGLERLDRLSNVALDLIHAGRLDEAERMCQQLLTEFPDVIDGHMRLGQLHRERGDAKQAAEHLRIAAAMARTPDYDPELAAGLDTEANELDPTAA
jgi:thioredoxin-like negative regulator of GroEL